MLQIPEQMLFDDSSRARKICLKHILQDLTSEERDLLASKVCEKKTGFFVPKDRFHNIEDLLIYAPEIFISKLESTLKEYKDLTVKFK